jgi:hypothetical protein
MSRRTGQRKLPGYCPEMWDVIAQVVRFIGTTEILNRRVYWTDLDLFDKVMHSLEVFTFLKPDIRKTMIFSRFLLDFCPYLGVCVRQFDRRHVFRPNHCFADHLSDECNNNVLYSTTLEICGSIYIPNILGTSVS